MTLPRAPICQQKFKQSFLEEQLIQLSERGCTNTDQGEIPCRNIQETERFQKGSLR
jgi:hypothetical protein